MFLSGNSGTLSEFQPGAVAWQPLQCRVSPRAALNPKPEAAGCGRALPELLEPPRIRGSRKENPADAASSKHRLCPVTESWDELSSIHGQVREPKCQQDHDTALALRPDPHLSCGFLLFQKDPYVNGLWDITYRTFSSYLCGWEGNKQQRFLPRQEERPVLGLQDAPHLAQNTTQQHQLPVVGTGHPNSVILTPQKNSDIEKKPHFLIVHQTY